MNSDAIAAIESERARLQQALDACNVILALYPPAPPTTVTARLTRVAEKVSTRRAVKAIGLVRPADASAAPSKKSRYSDAIMKLLSHHTLEPHHAADSAVIKREVARACGVNQATDTLFVGDIANALQGLKAAGRIERSGTMWALIQAEATGS